MQTTTAKNESKTLPHIIRWSPAITWTEVGLWLLVLFGAFSGALKRYAPIPQEFVTLGFDALCFGLLAYVLIKRVLHSRKIPYSPITIPLFIFVGFVFLTILNPYLTSIVRGILGWRFLASGLLFHFLGFYAFDDARRIRRFFSFLWLVAGIVSLYGIMQLMRGYTAVELAWINNLAATMNIAGTGRFRLMATMGGGVDLAFFMALSITSLVGYIVLQRRITVPKFILLSLMIVSIAFTYVRASWAAVFVGVLYLLIVRLWHLKKYRPLFPIFALVIIVFAVSLSFSAGIIASFFDDPALQERIASLANPLADRSMLDRFERWSRTWQLVKHYPYGIGVGMTGATALRYPNSPGPINITMDNSYLKIVTETGWIGLLLFGSLLISILSKGNQLYKKLNSQYKVDALTILACVITFMTILVFGEYIELNPGRIIIWIFTGFLFSLPRLQNAEELRKKD